MLTNSFRQLLIFGAVYCATQGALDSWDEAIELLYLSSYKVDVAYIALAQTLGVLPMAIKSILSIPSDITRLRKPFIFFGLLLSGSMFIIKTTFNPNSSFWAYCLCLMLRNTGAAISDGAVDGLTIDADVDALSGTISAWQGVGRMLGLIISTSVTGQLAASNTAFGYNNVLIFLGIWMFISLPVAFMVKEELSPSKLGLRLIKGYTYIFNIITCNGRLTNILRIIFTPVYNILKSIGLYIYQQLLILYKLLPIPKIFSSSTITIADFVSKTTTTTTTTTGTDPKMASTTVVENSLRVINTNNDTKPDIVNNTPTPTKDTIAILPNPLTNLGNDNQTISSDTQVSSTYTPSTIPPMTLPPAVPFNKSSSSSTTTGTNRRQRIQNLITVTDAPELSINTPVNKNENDEDIITMQSSALLPVKYTSSSEPSTPTSSSTPPLSPLPAPPEALDTKEAFIALLKHVQRTPVAAFVAFMFMGQYATYIASFPVVLWLSETRNFSVADVGILTVIGGFGNAAGCYLSGILFDIIPVKRLALLVATLLSGLPYLLFSVSHNFGEVTSVWTLCSVGYGAIYTVQVSQMRLLADKTVAASYSGLCMGMLAIAAAFGTTLGGIISDTDGWDYETCYTAGAITSGVATLFIPWITAEDPEIIAFKQKQRREREKLLKGKKRRRSSFRQWISRVRGMEGVNELDEEDKEYDLTNSLLSPTLDSSTNSTYNNDPTLSPLALNSSSPGFNTTENNNNDTSSMDALRRQAVVNQMRKGNTNLSSSSSSTSNRPMLRRPALGSMKNLLDAQLHESDSSISASIRRNIRRLFDDSTVAVRRFSNTLRKASSGRFLNNNSMNNINGSYTASSSNINTISTTTPVMNTLNTANNTESNADIFMIGTDKHTNILNDYNDIEIIPVDDNTISFDDDK